jgi:arabinofuranosyltransferase
VNTAPRRAWGLAAAAVVAAVFAPGVWRHAFIGDDAYISFRYAANLVAGHGPVFNPGERVEGYTNPSWVALMALVMALGGDPEAASLALGVLSGAAALLAVALCSERGLRHPLAWLAPLCLAANRSFTAWSTGGLETMLFSALVTGAFAAWLREQRAGRPGVSALLLAGAALTRPEGALFFGLAWLSWAPRWRAGDTPLSRWLAWSVAWGLPVGAHLGWRLSYYGAPLPNTFYAKVSGSWFSQGDAWLRWFLELHQGWLLVLLAGAALLWRRGRATAACAALAGLLTAYLLYVGGDRFEFRLLVMALPFYYLLAAEGVEALLAHPRLGRLGVVAAVALPISAALPTWTTPGQVAPRGVVKVEDIGRYASERAEEGRALRRLVEAGLLDEGVVIAVTGAGALPYFAGLPTIDVHGLNDATIARMEVSERGVIGHEKRAPESYLRERGVVLNDVLNRLVFSGDSRCPPPEDGLKCARGGGVVLIFDTTLDDAALRARLSGFELQ